MKKKKAGRKNKESQYDIPHHPADSLDAVQTLFVAFGQNSGRIHAPYPKTTISVRQSIFIDKR
ncbi:MAG TPA: hypothetical protein VK815_18905 [Candidatus Acidoferrales bacterium]|nr:hypothetical protein [Candidatus Acidoferrales bacterium]